MMPEKPLDEVLALYKREAQSKEDKKTEKNYKIVGFYNETRFKRTEIGMTPEDWEVIKLGEASKEMYYGITAKAVDYDSGLKMLRTTDIKNYTANWDNVPFCEITEKRKDYKKYLIKRGDLIVARAGTVGVSVLAERDFDNVIFGSYLIKVKLKDKLFPKFVHYFFQTDFYWRHISRAQGSTLKNINLPILKSIPLPIPPLPEQWGIAQILSTIDNAIQKSDELIAKIERLKKGLMQELLTKGIGHTKFKKTEIGKIPEEWKVARLKEVINEAKPGFASGKRDKKGIIQLRMNNITTDGRVILDEYLKVPIPKNIENYLLKPGDILFNNTNSVDLIGKTAIFRGECGFCTYSNHITRIRVKEGVVIPEWIMYYFIKLWSGRYFRRICVRHVGQAGIRKDSLLNTRIPLPSPDEQKKIAKILSTVDKWLELEHKRKEKLERLKKGLMNELLTGKIRVKVEVDGGA